MKLHETETTHDVVYDLAYEAGAVDLASYLFDTANSVGCNGIWAVADTVDADGTEDDASRRIAALMCGTLPPGILPHNTATKLWLEERWFRCAESDA